MLTTRSAVEGLSILALGAHPDDIELGCGGTLSKLARAGARIEAVVFSRGRHGVHKDEDRSLETRAALGALGIDTVTIYDFEDTRLPSYINEMVDVIESHISVAKPDRAYTMFQHDRHQDHRAVYEASAVACRSVPQLLGYETPSSYPNFMPTVFELIDADLETKVRGLKCHASQADRHYMQEEKIRSAASFRGTQIDMRSCEAFIPYKMII